MLEIVIHSFFFNFLRNLLSKKFVKNNIDCYATAYNAIAQANADYFFNLTEAVPSSLILSAPPTNLTNTTFGLDIVDSTNLCASCVNLTVSTITQVVWPGYFNNNTFNHTQLAFPIVNLTNSICTPDSSILPYSNPCQEAWSNFVNATSNCTNSTTDFGRLTASAYLTPSESHDLTMLTPLLDGYIPHVNASTLCTQCNLTSVYSNVLAQCTVPTDLIRVAQVNETYNFLSSSVCNGQDGAWGDGAMHNSTWKNGTWVDAHWVDGYYASNGSWVAGVWVDKMWKNGSWDNITAASCFNDVREAVSYPLYFYFCLLFSFENKKLMQVWYLDSADIFGNTFECDCERDGEYYVFLQSLWAVHDIFPH
jgi:hypothetical protein